METHRYDQFLPLKPATFHVLLALEADDLHGYGIKKAVANRSDGRIDLEPGMLYRTIARLVEQGLVEEADRRPVDEADERRRYYRITETGRGVLAADAGRLIALADSDDVRALAGGGR